MIFDNRKEFKGAVIGMILGDGYLRKIYSKNENSGVILHHHPSQKEYLLWKVSLLKYLTNVSVKEYENTIYAQTGRHPYYTKLRNRLYVCNRKVLSEHILKEAGIDKSTKAGKLSEDELSKMTQIIDRNYIVEGQLRRQIAQNIARLRDINSYRGVRHRRGLPVRGQCTQSNARTRKGPRKTVAGKKGVKEKR